MAASDKKTPMQVQWEKEKNAYPDAVLFFRMGDFYEMFGADAIKASEVLGLTLTTRDRNKEDAMPMAGIPHHQLERYLKEMVAAGIKVAICDQLEDPALAKGIVKRGVTRVITPGTLMEDSFLTSHSNNFLAAATQKDGVAGLACVDVSTGEFFVTETSLDTLADELERLAPAETLLPVEQMQPGQALARALERRAVGVITKRDGYEFSPVEGAMRLGKQFGVATLDGFGIADAPCVIGAAGAALIYLEETQKAALKHIRSLRRVTRENFLILDRTTQRNLELVQPLMTGGKGNTLLGVLDRTRTGPGGRLLRNWILRPLRSVAEIALRQQAVAELQENYHARTGLRELLSGVADMERIMARVITGRANARDLNALAASCRVLPGLVALGEELQSEQLRALCTGIDPLEDLEQAIAQRLVENPPLALHEGGLIREGFDAHLDELRSVCTGGKDWIAAFQKQEQERTGITSLKVGFNRVFGYYIEVSNTHKGKAPDDYERKQTLANAERFITPALKEREQLVLGAEEKIVALEFQIFNELREAAGTLVERVQTAAHTLAELDALAALAEVGASRKYCIPEVHEGQDTEIVGGRHPVLDMTLPDFTANDTTFAEADSLIHIITGPNMAGKSTYIRQVALLTILAQMGCGLPAASAKIGLCDRVFTRVGAADDLARGQSTFMVEMAETANILNNATPRSLVILDEVGRGTSTFDGVSLAWAITEYLHHKVGARTLFATHYHELAELGVILEKATNYNVAVRDWGGEVIFLHRIQPGSADRSYGIQVAKLAGLPKGVIERSKELLLGLEAQAADRDWNIANEGEVLRAAAREVQKDLFAPQAKVNDVLIDEIAKLDTDNLTPMQAHQKLQDLVRQVKERGYY